MKIYSISEIAEIFAVKNETVRWWKSQDPAFPPVVKVGRSWGLSESALTAWKLVKSSDASQGGSVRGSKESQAIWTVDRVESLLNVVISLRGKSVGSKREMAEVLGVSYSTLNRWLSKRGDWRVAAARIPVKRINEFLKEVSPLQSDFQREEFVKKNALNAAIRLRGRRVPFPGWIREGWLFPHRVYVEDLGNGVSSIRFTKVGSKRDRSLFKFREVETANRFEAVLVKCAVLESVRLWRVRDVGVGGTGQWINGPGFKELDLILESVRNEIRAKA